MAHPVVRMLNSVMPRVPWDIQEEVELYARESGRHARVHFVPGGGWFARFTLRTSDPRMELYQKGLVEDPPGEDVWFHVQNPNEQEGLHASQLKSLRVPICWPVIRMENGRCRMPFIPLDILQMGPSGVREFLERGNTWSGRGEHSSHEEALNRARAAEKASKERLRSSDQEDARKMALDRRRWWFKIPFVPVGIDLRKSDDATPKEK